jgi:hypothetical protein
LQEKRGVKFGQATVTICIVVFDAPAKVGSMIDQTKTKPFDHSDPFGLLGKAH